MRQAVMIGGLVALAGCAAIAGLSDFEDANGGAGGAGGTGVGGTSVGGTSVGGTGVGGTGAGGSDTSDAGGGGITVVAPPDWTDNFDAVYTFEEPTELGKAEVTGPTLSVGVDAVSDNDAIQGTGAALLSGPDTLASNDMLFATSGPRTFGGWMKLSADAEKGQVEAAISRWLGATGDGYRLVRGGAGRMQCQYGLGGSSFTVNSLGTHTMPDGGDWAHVVCRVNGSDGASAAIFWNGQLDATMVRSDPSPPAAVSFSIGATTNQWLGHVDEIFFTRDRLTNGQIARIHACGIDGALCLCAAASDYADCGRAAPNCAALAATAPCAEDLNLP